MQNLNNWWLFWFENSLNFYRIVYRVVLLSWIGCVFDLFWFLFKLLKYCTFHLSKGVPTVAVQQASYSVSTGNTVTLSCTVTSNLAVTDVYWQRNIGGAITQIRSTTNTNKYSGSTTSTPSLTIFNADQSDAGVYTCFATNSVGTGQSSTTTLSVTGSKCFILFFERFACLVSNLVYLMSLYALFITVFSN